ncbi:MAG: heterodisulfide reductase-related iron-sulfur binding cluster [Desulfomicrobium sp.]|nr:heterodisulfide reductase-related iron-sulfur binding cluster [Desulfomicrobium sp.]
MDQQELRQWEAKCTQEEPPKCRAGCPVNVDARAFVLAMAQGDLDAGRAILEKSMPLAQITARLCEAPCENFCLRKDLGGAIAIGRLEHLCIAETTNKSRTLRLPARPKTVAILGSAPSSLTVAYDLAKKGYPINLYHLGDKPGAWLRDEQNPNLPVTALDQELDRLTTLRVNFHAVPALDLELTAKISGDALFLGQDDDLAPDLVAVLGQVDVETMALDRPHWFTGGLPDREYHYISAVSQGREAAVSIDRYLQNASLTASRIPLRNGHTTLYTETKDIAPLPRLTPADSKGFTREEAQAEAGRCLDCQCLECVKHCVYLAENGAYPKVYARRIFNNLAIVQGMRQANTFINSCSLCGQCEVICPFDFSMAEMCLNARQTMIKDKRMPPSAHWFALEEMRSAGGEQEAFIAHAPGQEQSKVLFFPGCQLAGIRPPQTLALYDELCQLESATGLWLDCCGAPAHWSGQNQDFEQWLGRLETLWKELGEPPVVTACSSCLAMFREHLPQFKASSVWTKVGAQKGKPLDQSLALSDPCTARHDQETRTAVRGLLQDLGQSLADLPMSGELTECCGYGGLMENANPELARKVVQARVEQSESPFLTYCAMCRDQLAKTGKPVMHILDLLFPDLARDPKENPVGISQRRQNRRHLKNQVLARYGQKEMPPAPWADIVLDITPEVRTLLDERRILDDDVRQVLYAAHQGTAQRFQHPDGRRMASARIGQVTFWIEYREQGTGLEILCAWSHRMDLVGGQS